ncbi:hypothetical protein Pmani_009756 [Petrolisthes manimaculis]|uniref:Uncharacterized protein n=1 Tax=Petrolisthes manimaculis TaxID=1843537 RepID=A0AAE1UGF2_9EUCA|nr:hypothetical protein Pmani_009756 [Petrolisthes manimaculis]
MVVVIGAVAVVAAAQEANAHSPPSQRGRDLKISNHDADMPSVTAPCVGRKLRRRTKVFIQGFPLDTKLDSSAGEEEPITEEEKASEKLFFTIFRTLSSTATITILSTNRSVTVSVLLLCTESGVNYNLC